MEKDNEVKGEGNSLNYKYRMHDPRVGRFFAVDPLESRYPFMTPYQFASNSPIGAVEVEGLEGEEFRFRQWMRAQGGIQAQAVESEDEVARKVVKAVIVDMPEAVIDGVTFTTTSLFGGIWVGGSYGYREFRYGDGDIGKPEWHNYIQWGFSWENGFQQDGYNSGKGSVSPEDGLRLFEGVTAFMSIGEITNLVKLHKVAAVSDNIIFEGLSKSKTTSIVGSWDDIKVLDELTTISKNSPNKGGLSRLSNDEAWTGLIEKYKHIADDTKRWKAINDYWWNNYNQPWLDEIIKRGDDIKVVSDTGNKKLLFNGDGSKRHFKREIEYLESKGYVEKDGYFVKE